MACATKRDGHRRSKKLKFSAAHNRLPVINVDCVSNTPRNAVNLQVIAKS